MSDSHLDAFFTVPSGVTISVTNNGGGPTAVSIAAGSYTATSFATYLASALTTQRAPSSGAWSVFPPISTGGRSFIGISAGTFSITWTSTLLRDLLGFTGDLSGVTSATSTNNQRGVWFPDCPLDLEGDPDRAPIVSDLRHSQSPTGGVVGLKGTQFYRHRMLRWTHVARALTWTGSATTTYADFESWWNNTQLSNGHAWFSVASAFQAHWDYQGATRPIGYDLNASGPTTGWKLVGVNSIDQIVKKRTEGWLGYWSVEFPTIVSEG